jgi:hypothetical protein
LGRNRCPNCGKRVPEYEPCCPRCGHPVLLAFQGPEDGVDPALDEGDEWGQDGDEGIDDPELLERAEASVRALPLREHVVVEETPEPAPLGGACPVCGRQAQKGWKICPWCRSALPA